MNEYEQFLAKYFPEASMPQKEELEGLYKSICKNNFMTKIYLKYLDNNTLFLTAKKIIFLSRYRSQLNKLLIYIPLNDSIGINACMRYCVEQLLKFLYSIYINEDVDKINSTKYRIIKDKLLENIDSMDIEKDDLIKLFSYYGIYSNEIHDKRTIIEDEICYLQEILIGQNEYIKNVNRDVKSILKIYNKIMIRVFRIRSNQLASFEIIKLPQIVGKKEAARLIKKMDDN